MNKNKDVALSHCFQHARRFRAQTLALICLFGVAISAQATPAITPDGNTQTNLATNGSVTDITTSTVVAQNAYNSFSNFNVEKNTVVNMILPDGTSNLLNLVNNQAMTVDGILNSIKDGKIGGNVFFADPFGVFIGKSGVVNVGSFAALTPTKGFMDSMFTSSGNPSSDATAQLIAGSVPISADGLISIQGKINATTGIFLAGGSVANAGTIASGAVFSGSQPDFSDVVNVNGLESGTHLSVQNGNIEIRAAGDFENAGTIATDGADNLNAANIDIQAGGDVKLDSGSSISASGHGSNSNGGVINVLGQGDAVLPSGVDIAATGGEGSGNGGAIDFSAKGTLTLNGGLLKAGAANGIAGTVTLDPTDMTINANQQPNDGSNLSYSADESITVDPGVTISSRQIGSGTDALNSPSTGDSGNISFTAPHITIGNGDQILANATDTYVAGNITFTATPEEVTAAQAVADASIDIGDATISGGDITLTAISKAVADNTVNGFVQGLLDDLHLGFLINNNVSEETSSATSTITIGTATGTATLAASGDVSIDSEAGAETKIDVTNVLTGFAYGESHATATATVSSGATITADGKFDLSARSDNGLEVLSSIDSLGLPIAVSYGYGTSTSNATVDGSVTAEEANIESENSNKFATEAKGFDFIPGGGAPLAGGVGVSLGFYQSNANTSVTGTVKAENGDIKIASTSTNETNETRSESEVNSGTPKDQIINNFFPFLGTLDKVIKAVKGVKSEANPNVLGIAASVSYVSSSNKAQTTTSGTVDAQNGSVSVLGTAHDNPQVSAAGSSGGALATIGGGVAIADFKNEADATVTGNADVTAGTGVTVKADAEIPNPVAVAVGELADTFDFTGIDFSGPAATNAGDGWAQSLWHDTQSLYNGVKKAQADVKDPGAFFTSFTNTGFSASESSSNTGGIAGSVDLTNLTNKADAHIDGTATVTTDTGNVDVNAIAHDTMINVAGMAFSLDSVIELNPGVKAGGSLGGAYAGITLNNSSKAYIGDGTDVTATAGDVNVTADTQSFALNIYQSGDQAEKFGITGAFSSLDVNDTAEAFIQSDAKVNAGGSVGVTATNKLTGLAIGGALGIGGTVQVGVTTAWNTVNDKTLAYIGDPSNSRAKTDRSQGSGVTAGDSINVNAHSTENVYSISLAASKSGASGEGADGESATKPEAGSGSSTSGPSPEPAPGESTPPQNAPSGKGAGKGKGDAKGGAYGFGVSANIAFNKFTNPSGDPGINTQAFINNGAKVTATTGDINVKAKDDSFLVAVAVSGAMGQTVSLAGALSWNKFIKEVDAYTANAELSGKGLLVTATNNGGFFDISAGGSVNTEEGVALAGSVNRNLIDNTTNAYVGDGTANSGTIGTGGITISSTLKDTVVSVPGAVAIGTTSGGVGAAVDIGLYTNNTNSYVGNAQLTTVGNVSVTADATENLYPIAWEVAGGAEFGVGGSVTWEDLNNDTEAYIDGQYASVYTPDSVLVSSQDTTNRLQIAGDISGAGETGVGISAAVNIATRKVKAYIGPTAVVDAGGNGTALSDGTDSVSGIRVHASQGGNNSLYAAGGSGAGELSGAGSAVVNVLNDTTMAYVAPGAKINQYILSPSVADNVEILAGDTTNLLSLGGAGGFGGESGIGAGADVTVINKDTKAYVGASAKVNANGDVKVDASSTEDLSSLTGSAGIGGSAGVAGASSVYVIHNKTKAYIDSNATVLAQGSVLVSAQDVTDLDTIAGNVAVGGEGGFGASVPVDVITKDTEAWIASGASVTALGLRPSIDANNGQFNVTYPSNVAYGEVPAPHLPASILQYDNDPALQHQRLATPQTVALQGVGVTATSTTANKSMVVAGGGSAALGASISSAVTVAHLTTSAHIDPNAKVNTENDSGAGTDQSVLVAAGSDYYHMAMLGAVSFSGEGGSVGPAVDVAVASNDTSAYVGTGAEVDAAKDISVVANDVEDFVSLSAGIGGSAFIGAAGSVSTTTLNDQTYAYFDGNSTARAGGNVIVSANDATKTDSVDGALAIGIEGGGVGGSVAVTTLNKDTQAYVGGGATVDAGGNSDPVTLLDGGSASGLIVAANSSEDVFSATMAGAGGLWGGVAGAVSVENIRSSTSAYIGGAAQINQDTPNAASDQAVNVDAKNETDLTSYDGALGAAAGGIAGGVDVGIVDNNTSANIGDNAKVNAKGDVGVWSSSTKKLYDLVASAGVGVVAVAGAVSVFAVDTKLDTQSQDYTGGAGGYADNQSDPNAIAATLPTSDASTQAQTDVGNSTGGSQNSDAVSGATFVPAGTSAFVGSGATVDSGGNIDVNATETHGLNMNDGSVGIGGVSVGASVGVANINSNTTAYADNASSLGADGDINIGATLAAASVQGKTGEYGEALNGVVGSISLGGSTSIINDTSSTAAYLGSGADVTRASTLDISATSTRTLNTDSKQGAIGIGTAAGGLSLATSHTEGSTKAYVAPNATIGADSNGDSTGKVANVTISSSSNDTAIANTAALAAGIGLAAGQLNIAKAQVGPSASHPINTQAYIGQGANIQATGSIGVDAGAATKAHATTTGFAASTGLSVGGSIATATATLTVKAYADKNAVVHGDQDVSFIARANYDSAGHPQTGNDVSATAKSSSGGLVGGTGAKATATSHPTVAASAGDGAKLTAGNSASITSQSASNVSSSADGYAYGALAGGLTSANSTIDNNNNVETGTGTTINAGTNATLSSQSNDVITRTDTTGGEGGLLSASGTKSTASLTDTTATTLGPQTQVIVPGGNILIEALASIEAHSYATDTTTVTVVGSNQASATTTVTSSVTTTVGDNATVHGGVVEIDAKTTKFIVDATAHAGANGVDANPEADADLEAGSDPKVAINTGANIIGDNSINLVASIDEGNTVGNSDASSETGVSAGKVTANSTNNLTLNSEIDVASGATLSTSNLDVEATSPKTKEDVYKQTADAAGNTVITYVTTKIKQTVNKVFGWIPFVGPLVKKVTQWVYNTVETIVSTSESAHRYGAFSSTNAIHMNGTIHQQNISNPILVVDQNGNIQQASGIDATVGPSQITVNNIANSANSVITLDAPGGLIDGTMSVHRDTVFPTVTIINNSAKDLWINGIQPEATNGSNGDFNLTADTDNAIINFESDATSSAISIANNSGSNIWFGGYVNEPSGSLSVTNTGGSIFGADGNLLKINDLSLAANHGAIGGPGNYLNVQLQSDGASGAQISVIAGQDLYLNARLVQNLASDPGAGYTIPGAANFNSVLVGDNVNLNLQQPEALVIQPDGTFSPVAANGTYNLNNSFAAGGDVNIDTGVGGAINLAGTLTSGFSDINFVVAVDGGVNANAINYASSIDGTNVVLRNMQTQGGHVVITGDGSINGLGTIRVLDGYSQLNVVNNADRNLVVGNVDFNNPAAGSITLFGAAQPLSGTALGTGLTLASYGHPNAGISIDNNGFGNELLTGVLGNSSGLTEIGTAHGNIFSAGSGQSINSHDILLAAAGGIGTSTNYLNVLLAGGHIDATASGDIFIDPATADLPVGTIISTSGDIDLLATGSIVNATGASSRIEANNIYLVALDGSLGTSAAGLNVVLHGGHVDGSAQGDVYLNAVSGDLPLGTITSGAGDIFLTSAGSILNVTGNSSLLQAHNITLAAGGSIGTSTANINVALNGGHVDATTPGNIYLDAVSGDLPVGYIASSAGNITLTSAGSILNATGAASLLQAQNITLVAGGSIGTAPANINVALNGGHVDANAPADIYLNAVTGDLPVGNIASSGGDINLTSAGSILNVTGNTSLLQAQNITLAAGGSIGTAPANINVALNDGQVDANATGSIYLDAVLGDLPVGTIVSTAGDVILTAYGSILNANGSTMALATLATDPPAIVTGNNVDLIAQNGGIGTAGNRLTVNSNGIFNLDAAGDVYVEETAGDLLSNSMTSHNGLLDILVNDGNGSFGQLSAATTVTLLVQGNELDVSQLTAPDGFSAAVTGTGGQMSLGDIAVGGTVTLQSDNINLVNASNVSDTDPLHFDVTGNAGGIADNIDVNVSSTPPVVFTRYWTNYGSVNAQTDFLLFDSAIIGASATFQNNWDNVSLAYKTDKQNSSSTQVQTQDVPFYIYLLADKLQTNGHPNNFINATLLDPTKHFGKLPKLDWSSL